MWDLAWVTDPSAWAGLGTLILLEVVLGVDNLVPCRASRASF